MLIFQVVLGDSQAAHAIGLRPQNGFQLVRWDYFKIVCEIEARGAIQNSAVRLDQLDEFHLAEILRALEHHVFEEVREARTILRLDAKSDAVIDTDANCRRGVILRKHYA